MNTLADYLENFRDGTRMLSLKPLPSRSYLQFVKAFKLRMTWSPGSAVHVYVVKHTVATVVLGDGSDGANVGPLEEVAEL